MKGGAGAAALKDGPCDNILIEDNTVFHAHGGFVIGSEFSGGMVNIVVRNNTFSGTDTGLRFKSAPERGGKTENIWISDIYMSDIQGEAVVFETSYADRPVGKDDAMAAETENPGHPHRPRDMPRRPCRRQGLWHAADDSRHHPGRLPLLLYGRSIPGR